MNKIHLLILTLMMALNVSAQELSINSFTQANGDLSARTNLRVDANGEPCALVRVYVLDNITSVEGESVGEPITKGIEKWIYLCNGVKHFKLNLQYHYPIEVSFTDFNMAKAESNCVYVLKISDGKVSGNEVSSTTFSNVEEIGNSSTNEKYAKEIFEKGMNYFLGRGVAQDYTKAIAYYREAADLGFANAQNYLGYCYEKGYGVMQDYSQAASWYRKAADKGNASAQYNLGVCYVNGNGMPQDYSEAVNWLRKAAEQGHPIAQSLLGNCYVEGEGVPQNYTQAVFWFRKSAEQGYARGQYNLGVSYVNGDGVPKDYTQAVFWLRKAAEQGDNNAKIALQRLKDEGKI